MNHVIVRDNRAGVYFGERRTRASGPVVLFNARHIYQWSDRISTADIAARGVGEGSKVVAPVMEIALYDPIAVIRCTPNAAKQIAGVKSWEK